MLSTEFEWMSCSHSFIPSLNSFTQMKRGQSESCPQVTLPEVGGKPFHSRVEVGHIAHHPVPCRETYCPVWIISQGQWEPAKWRVPAAYSASRKLLMSCVLTTEPAYHNQPQEPQTCLDFHSFHPSIIAFLLSQWPCPDRLAAPATCIQIPLWVITFPSWWGGEVWITLKNTIPSNPNVFPTPIWHMQIEP